jgi:hypothetical protein
MDKPLILKSVFLGMFLALTSVSALAETSFMTEDHSAPAGKVYIPAHLLDPDHENTIFKKDMNNFLKQTVFLLNTNGLNMKTPGLSPPKKKVVKTLNQALFLNTAKPLPFTMENIFLRRYDLNW